MMLMPPRSLCEGFQVFGRYIEARVPPCPLAKHESGDFGGPDYVRAQGLIFLKPLLDRLEGALQFALLECCRKVAPGPLGHTPHHVGNPSKVVGQGVREVDRDKQAVDIIHHFQETFRLRQVIAAQDVEGSSP